jgi:hypothetical protein
MDGNVGFSPRALTAKLSRTRNRDSSNSPDIVPVQFILHLSTPIAVQPFAIYCTTCKARLRVTDPSFIGQILACPKCESMVLVEPPPAGTAETPTANKPAALSGSSSVVLRAPIAAPPPLPQVAPPQVAPAIVVPERPTGRAPDARAQTAPAKAPQNWTLFAGGIAVGVVIGAAIWMLVAMRGTDSEPVAVSTAKAATIDAAPKPSPAPEQTTTQAIVAPPEVPAAPQPQPVEVLKPVAEPTADEPTADDPTVAETKAPPETNRPEVVQPDATDTESPAVPVESERKRDEPVAEPAEATEPGEVVEPTPEPVTPKSVTTDPQLAQLNVRLPKVAFNKVPLRQFATFAAEASGSKIVIDYRSLRAAGFKTPTITARASDCTLSELLHESLDEIGLSFEPREGSIVIFVP